jgi:hypothetical protein
MGQKGVVLDTTLMSAEQLAAHKARESRSETIVKAAIEAAEPKGNECLPRRVRTAARVALIARPASRLCPCPGRPGRGDGEG